MTSCTPCNRLGDNITYSMSGWRSVTAAGVLGSSARFGPTIAPDGSRESLADPERSFSGNGLGADIGRRAGAGSESLATIARPARPAVGRCESGPVSRIPRRHREDPHPPGCERGSARRQQVAARSSTTPAGAIGLTGFPNDDLKAAMPAGGATFMAGRIAGMHRKTKRRPRWLAGFLRLRDGCLLQ
jgi:hypothetical protein